VLVGGGILVVLWAIHIAWIARAATDRGRSVVLWVAIGGTAGICGGLGARELVRALDSDSASSLWLLCTLVLPLALVLGPMVAIALALTRGAARAPRRRTWRVHSGRRGGGRLTFTAGGFVVEWDEGRDDVPVAAITASAADGECVRLAWQADGTTIEHVLMPREKPDTRPGRQAQSRTLAAQIAALRRSRD
jgi:hypothetical protein